MNELLRNLLNVRMAPDAEPSGDGGGDPAPAGDPAPDGGDGGNIAAVLDTGDPTPEPTDNWRTPFGEDAQATLERYGSQADMGKAFMEARQLARDGTYLKPITDNATDADIADYREKLGVPAEISDYYEALPEGSEIDEESRPFFDGLATALQGEFAKPGVFATVIEELSKMDKGIADQQTEDNFAKRTEMDATLRDEWAGDYRPNINRMQAVIDAHLEGDDAQAFLNATLMDGTLLFNNRAFLEMMVTIGREQNPSGFVLDSSTSDPIQKARDELTGLKDRMANDRTAYFKDDAAQDRYIVLQEAIDKHDAKDKK